SSIDATNCTATGSWSGSKGVSGSETLNNLTRGTKTYSVTCSGVGGSVKESVVVLVVAKPAITFAAVTPEIASGNTATLRWSVTDATSCVASGDWSEAVGVSGTYTTPVLETGVATYTLTCTGPGGSSSKIATVTVVAPPGLTFRISDEVVEPGDSVTLDWSSTNTRSCRASGSWSGEKAISGTETLSNLSRGTQRYAMSCSGVAGTARVERTLVVAPKPTVTLSAAASQVNVGQGTTLTWSSTEATACVASGDWAGDKARTGGTQATGPLSKRSSVFTLTCTGPGGSAAANASVEALGTPKLNFSISAALVPVGQRVTLTWTSTEANSCSASGSWGGPRAVAGVEQTEALAAGVKTYTLKCEMPGSGFDEKTVTVEAVTPVLATSATSLAFGKQLIGSVSEARAVTLTNTSVVPLSINGISLAGGGATQFLQSNTCGATLESKASCEVSVSFKPGSIGDKAATLLVNSNATTPQVSIGLTGVGAAPSLQLAETSVAFGTVSVGSTSAVRKLVLRNTGNAPLVIGGIVVTGTDAAQFVMVTDCNANLAPEASCNAEVSFKPGSAGVKGASLTVTSNDAASPANIALSGTGTAPQLVLGSTNVSFGSVNVGAASEARVIAVRNEGNAPLVFGAVGLSGADAGQFVQRTDCAASLAIGASCNLTLTFQPTSAGDKTATVSIASNASSTPATILLSGRGAAPVVTFAATELPFGSVNVGATSALKTMSLRNTGDAALTISGITLTGTDSNQYQQTNDCGTTLSPAASCLISVTFKPTSAGDKTANVSVASNAASQPAAFALTGKGTAPVVVLSSAAVAFGTRPVGETSDARAVTLKNEGDATLDLTSITLAGADANQFLLSHDCAATLAAAQSCVLTLRFKPTSAGVKAASVSIASNAAGSPATLPISGQGTAPKVVFGGASIGFGTVNNGSASAAKTVILRNEGDAVLQITSITTAGPDNAQFTQTNDCGATLAVGATCTISVTFRPTSEGNKTASLSLISNSLTSPDQVALEGTGRSPLGKVVMTPASLSFGVQTVGTTSSEQVVTIRNEGDGPLQITALSLPALQVSFTDQTSYGFPTTQDCAPSLPRTLAAGASCLINVRFAPGSTTATTGKITVTTDFGSAETTLSGTGTGAIARVNNTLLQFGDLSVGQTSTVRTVTLRNDGNAPLSISAINTSGTDAAQFNQSNNCGSSLVAGANCTISVTFTPTSSGSKSAAVSIAHSATGSPRLVSLTGNGLAVLPGAPTLEGASAGNNKITLTFGTPSFTGGTGIVSYEGRCIGSGITTTATGTASPLSVVGLVNGTPYVCDVRASNSVGAGPYSSTRSATPTGVEVSGSIVLAAPLQIDGDTNDSNATTSNGTRTSNNTFATAQTLFAPFVLGGYVTLPGVGPSGAVRVAGDTADIYRVNLRANQIVSLQAAARTPAEGDLDLFLYTAPGAVMSRSSTTTSRLETVVVPTTGEYFIEVRAFAGSSRYLLEVSDSSGAAALGAAAAAEQGLFVADEAIVVPRVRSAAQPSGGIARSGAGSLSLSTTDAAGVAETLEVLASRSNGALRVHLGDVMSAAQRTRKGVNAAPLPAGASFASGEQEQRLRTVLRIKEIGRDPNVLSAEPNYLAETTAIPGGSGYARQRWHYDLLRAPAAWDVGTGSSNVTVAIVDSGVSPHPDVSQNLLSGYDFVSSDANGDGNGRDADASDPGVFASNDRGASARRHSHGTHVAGTAAARFTGASKVSGVAGGSRILPVRVLDAEGAGSSWDIADGIRYAAGLGTPVAPRKADVINLSLRGTGSCPQSIQSAINEARAAGASVVAAAGNDGRSALGWPANCDGVIAVGAVDPRKSLATYSNFGSQLDLVAPGGSGQGISGEDVYSSDIERIGTGGATYIERAIAGTSMAAPHVTGLIALMKQAKPDLTPTQVDNLLANGSMTDDLGAAGKDAIFGNGLANAYKAVVNANSSSANSSARIYTSTSALNFGDSYASWDVYVTLVGLEEVLVSASSSQGWIQVATPTFVDARTLKYTITVNRNILADGFLDGTIVFSPSAGPQVTVSVSVTKRSQTVSGKLGFQYALLVDAASLNTIYQVSGPVAGAETPFTFSNVSAGRYFLIAGSDLDNDGFICGAAEACAYYPLTSDPEALEVDAQLRGIKLGSAYLPLALTSSVDGAASFPIDGAPLEGFPVTPGRMPATASSRQRLLPAALPASGMQLRPGVVPSVGPAITAPSIEAPASTPSPAQVITSTALVIEGPSIAAAASTTAVAAIGTPSAAEVSATVVSEVVDLSSGGEYVARETRVSVTGERDWVLEYRSQGSLLGVAPLSRTMDVLWRAVDGAGISLPSSTWTQICDGQVWSAQDGYQLIVGARARGSLQTAWEGEAASLGAAAVTHLTGVACAGSTLTLQGYAFELGPRDPALMSGPIKSQRFTLALDDRGNVITRSLRAESIAIATLCAGAVAEERRRSLLKKPQM
ncbi:MAG: choice-of-anchor D domain-containing protein, partial [Gammaproteobacteria bacterium]|nr:choice-of-anchor D domain-containing protein [Gammaproteobacteria bacterium]